MSFDMFSKAVNSLISKAGGNLGVQFRSEDGKHYAQVSDGTVITGNNTCLKIGVRWGANHFATASV